jgi:L-arabinose isomerase
VKPLGTYELWFAAGSQTLYGEQVLAQVDAHARTIAQSLDAAPAMPVEVVAKPVLIDSDSIRRLCLEASSTDRCVGVIAWMHTFSPAKMWIAGLGALRKPLLHLHTQFDGALPWGEVDMDYMNLNQSAHGDREFGFLETRIGQSRKTVAGHWSDPAVVERVATWARAACGWREAQTLKVARFGDNMRSVAVTDGDKVEFQARLGVAVDGYGVGDLVAAVSRIPDADVDGLAAEYETLYSVVPALRRGAERHEPLRQAARIELGLRAFLDEGGFGAFTDTFEDLGALPQLPGIAAQRLMADGYGFAAEGDWKTAALVRILKVMATGLPGGTSFMEDYTYHLGADGPRVVGAHMLEICPSIADGTPTCEIHPLSIGGKDDPVRLVFTASPGPAVVLSIADLGSRFRLLANTVESIGVDGELPKLPVAHATWRPQPDFTTAVESWLVAGGSHHTVYTQALGVDALRDFAEIAGLELAVIDESTSTVRFQQELRWNSVYHHLARGL